MNSICLSATQTTKKTDVRIKNFDFSYLLFAMFEKKKKNRTFAGVILIKCQVI